MHARNEEFLHASRVTRPRVWTGLLLNESYKVGSLVEQGAATEIYDGTEVSTGEPVALKILLPQLAADAKTRALFVDEARALRRLSQPGLLRYRACARDPESDLTYIVTDVVGMRLSSRLASRKLSEDDVVALTKRLALALAAAHGAGVIHRGLRPHAKALPQGRLSDATITDFNLIKTAHSGLNAAFDDAMVDHDYCAPEQLSTSGEGAVIGPWTDVYSLALVILSTLGGKQTDAERKANPDLALLPKKLRPVLERMLEPKPARRLQSMEDVVKQIDLPPPSASLRSLFDRAPSLGFPRFGRTAERETAPPPARPVAPAPVRQTQPAPSPPKPAPSVAMPPVAAESPKALAAAPASEPLPPLSEWFRQAAPTPVPPVAAPTAFAAPPKAPVVAPASEPLLSPLPESFRPAAPKPVSPVAAPCAFAAPPKAPPLPDSRWPAAARPVTLGKFHERRRSIGLGGVARRTAVAASALLLAASPWIIQTSLPPGPADASTAPPKVQAMSKGELAERAAAALPQGRVYGADNSFSRITLRFHRPTRVTVHARQRLLFSRAVQPGDSYRAPSLAELAVTTEDAGAVEVLFNGKSGGFVGENARPVERESLTRFASLAPASRPNNTAVARQAPPPPAKAAEPGLSAEQAEALAQGIAAIEQAAAPAAPVEDLSTIVIETDPPVAEAPVEQQVASLAPPPSEPVVELPEPPATVEITPSRVARVAVLPLPVPQPSASPPAAAEPEAPRTLLQRLFTRAPATTPAPAAPNTAATALILAPAITKEAADRAKAASDAAKAALDAVLQKSAAEQRRRDRAMFYSTLGVTSPY
jgi:serine/threonine protein kinase